MADGESEQMWTPETEGRVALLFRDLACSDSDESRKPIFAKLRDLTGCTLADDMSRWLQWYLEDHLGMRKAISILAGTANPGSESENVSLMEEQVFERAEYNWCALERIDNKDDMLKLRMLYSDLESVLRTEQEGPFSFARLSGADQDDMAYFHGKCLSEALFDKDVQLRHLRILKNYGKMMMMPVFPSPSQRAGAIVYASAISQALVRFNTKITSLSFLELGESLPGLLDRPYIVDSYAKLFRNALERCK